MSNLSAGSVDDKDPKATAVSLARYLLCISPDEAEWGWQTSEALNDSPGKWFAIEGANRTTYMMAGDSGRFSVTPPSGVDPASLPVIQKATPPPTQLRAYLDSLVKTIAGIDPGFAAGVAAIANAARHADDLAQLCGELQALVFGFAMHSPEIPDADFASSLEVETRRRFLSLQIPGTLASVIYLLTRIVRVAMPVNLVHQAFALGGSLDIFDGPQAFLRDVLAKIIQLEGGEAKIAEAAEALQADAESFADTALAAKDFGDFYGIIFDSLPVAYAAQQGFEFLANSGAAQSAHYRLLANVCEERCAPAYATMEIDFRNSMDWGAIERHRAAIYNARKSGGDQAAEQLADQFINLALLYPPFTRDFLLGKTDTLPLESQ